MAVSKLVSRLGKNILPPECVGPHRFVIEGNSGIHSAPAALISPRVREPTHSRGAGGPYGPPPLALVFGWAGASNRNLAKYSDIYLNQGCTTAHLTLPTRLIFKDTSEVPEAMSSVLEQLEEVGVRERPVLIHCLSDTGAMCYQGLRLATQGERLDVRGVVWDSCPGPIPEISLARVAALLTVNWFCARQDGDSRTGALASSYRLLLERGWPNYLRKLKGLSVDLSLMEGVWAGHFGRDHFQQHKDVAELFLYSNSDFYLPAKYLESQVLARRRKQGVNFSATRFRGSAHVQHFRKHPQQYEEAVREFLQKAWGREEVQEVEEVQEQVQEDGRRRRRMEGTRFPQLTGSFGL